MPSLDGSRTHANLKEAFSGESQANRRYLYFARRADIEGHSELAALFRDTAEGETGHALGHLDFLSDVGDPATGEPLGTTEQNLASAIAGETYEFTAMYPGFARTAREEGFEEVADWFATLARAEKTHAGRFQKGLDALRESDQADADEAGGAGADRGGTQEGGAHGAPPDRARADRAGIERADAAAAAHPGTAAALDSADQAVAARYGAPAPGRSEQRRG